MTFIKMKISKVYLFALFTVGMGSCDRISKKPGEELGGELQFNSSDTALVRAFNWAKNKALSYAHDSTDAVGYWYEAALPKREAFCMRDVSHQALGAEILGLSKQNSNMLLKFAQNISEKKDYGTYWEINRYDKPAPADYENDRDFWYNLPANFDLTYCAYRLYNWTGNTSYLENPVLKNFYTLSLNEYVDRWRLAPENIVHRDRLMHIMKDTSKSRFGMNRGIPTYNEGGRGETNLGIDLTASLIAAYTAYSKILRFSGEADKSPVYEARAQREREFLDTFWWDSERREYRSIEYDDGTFDYFMVGHNQAFLHYLLYFDVVSDPGKKATIVSQYASNYDSLIVELKSYLPIIFYEDGRSGKATDMILELCNANNQRRDYPEISFTVIEHLTRGLMGINAHAPDNSFSTLSRLESDEEWAEMKHIPLLSNIISVKHEGLHKTTVANEKGKSVKWTAKMPGHHHFLYIDGRKTECAVEASGIPTYSYVAVKLGRGEEVTVSVNP